MSRGGRDDDRADLIERAPERDAPSRSQAREQNERAPEVTLPRGEVREIVEFRGRAYSLNGSETRALQTVGAFRVVSPDSIEGGAHGPDVRHGDWRHLSQQGLLVHETITDRDGSRQVVALTRDAKDLLDAHTPARSNGSRQAYYAGIVKPRELAHDARIYDAYREEAARIERAGGRVTRVVLDYELKRDYQTFLHRDDRRDDGHAFLERREFAESHDLPVHRGHVVFPDVRIEYELDGRLEHRDVEVLTEHYSRGQRAGKAGFSCHGGNSKSGGAPFDPRHTRDLS
ncbi:MAG TPA: hypothetical protein VJN96_06225 [Vicinamibacterales bacterium]|nr:hypothetical protein [Vicinamibacterales bacterium]